MFTGLVQDIGTLKFLRQGPMTSISVAGFPFETAVLGESIAVNGICLSVVSASPGLFSVEASAHTCEVTSIHRWIPGKKLHLERALRLGDRLGGHIVQGHVDGVSKLESRRYEGDSLVLRFHIPEISGSPIVPRGSIAIDGVSLTVSALSEKFLEVTLIPDTQKRTALAELIPGDTVNIETDVIGKYVSSLLKCDTDDNQKRITESLLARSGFI